MTLINHRWRPRDIRIFERQIELFSDEMLLSYDLKSEPIRIYFTEVGIFGGFPNINPYQCIESRIYWNNIESVEFINRPQNLKLYYSSNLYNVAILRFKEELNDKELIIKQRYWYGNPKSYIINNRKRPLLQNNEFILLLPLPSSYQFYNKMIRAREILEEEIKEVI